MMRVLFAACCLVGLVLGGAFAPAVGIQTPISDLGADGDGEGGFGGGEGSQSGGADDTNGESGGNGEKGENGESGENSENNENDKPPGENSGTSSYGGVSAGGYPEQTTVGGKLELSDHPELLIRAPEQSRWRLGSYSRYTGDGFERDERDREPLTEAIPTAGDDSPSPEYDIRVEPQRPMNTLVTVWRPAFGDAENRAVSVSEGRALTVEEPIASGELYATVTYGPPSRTEAAERSGQGSYPSEIERRYTQLPEDTPQRLGEKTESIADDSGAETPFEMAQAVDSWLKTNKEYSLNATHDRSNDVADEFVFEMDAGYCQYFATAMTAMLRTQGVPARYVTGYSGGEQVGENEYLVRGKHAHAWVEVYITDVGWVTFDPTAAGGRLDAGRTQAPVDDLGEEPESEESPEDDEQKDNQENNEDEQNNDQENNEDEEEVTESVNVTLTPDPVPGREVTVTVTREDEPISDATVRFNGNEIGETDASGNVTAEVPYNSSLEVEVLIEGERSQFDTSQAQGSNTPSLEESITKQPQSLEESVTKLDSQSRLGKSRTGGRKLATAPRTQLENQNATFSFDVPTEIAIELTEEPVAGSTVDIEATIDDEPVRDGEVSLDNEPVARTDDDGIATIELPDAETANLVVERDEARGNRTLNLTQPPTEEPQADEETAPLQLSVAPSLFIALPGTTATLNVTHEGTPVSNATIAVGGNVVGETAADGPFEVSLPLADSTTLAATATVGGEQTTATATLDGLYQRLAAVAAVAAVGLAALFVSGYRRGFTPRTAGRLLGRIVTGTGRILVASVVAFGRTLETAVETAVRLAHRTVKLLGDGIEGAITLVRAIRNAIVAAGHRFVVTLRTLPARLHPLALLAFLKGLRRSAAESVTAMRGGNAGSDDATATDETLTIQEAWSEFRRYVTVRSWRTSTPGEVARWAVRNDGLPADAVRTLRDAFRAVEYGNRSQEGLAPKVETALEKIRTSHGDDEEGSES